MKIPGHSLGPGFMRTDPYRDQKREIERQLKQRHAAIQREGSTPEEAYIDLLDRLGLIDDHQLVEHLHTFGLADQYMPQPQGQGVTP
jgi:hypothetical protein